MRVQLKPGLRRAWRGPDRLQIGTGPGFGTILVGVTPTDLRTLDRLGQGVDLPPAGGPQVQRQHRLAQLLLEAGLLVGTRTGRAAFSVIGPARPRLTGDAAVWSLVHPDAGDGWGLLAGRAARQVAVVGLGRTGTALAATLRGAGVGRVTVSDPRPVTEADLLPGGLGPQDVGRRREEAVAEALTRARPDAPHRIPRPALPGGAPAAGAPPGRPDLVVLVRYAVADAGQAEPLLRADIPHLSVLLRGRDAVVGPLVVPGQGPCLRCLDLHRSDRDPDWPGVLAQLLHRPAGPRPADDEPEEAATAALVAGLAGLQVLARLDGQGRPATLGATLEVELPDGLVGRRPWPVHPACGCCWPPRDGPAGPGPGPVLPEPVSGKHDQGAGPTMSG